MVSRGWLGRLGRAVTRLTELPPVEDDSETEQAVEDGRSVTARRRRAAVDGRQALPERSRERVPPGQCVTQAWPRLDDGKLPFLPDERWSLSVSRGGGGHTVLDLSGIRAMPMREMVSDIHCVTGWSRLGMRWKGVQARVLAGETGMDVSPGWVMARSVDGYCANLPMARFMDEDAMVALEADGEPLSREHGGPVRLLLPGLYLWKSVKWLAGLEGMAVDRRGTWEGRGYHNGGDPWLEQRWRLAERPEDGHP